MTYLEPDPAIVEVVPDSPYGAPPTRRHQIQIFATVAVVIAAIVAVTVSVVGGSGGSQVSNARLLRLIHAASNSIGRAPSTTMQMTMDISADGHGGQMVMSGVSSRPNHESKLTLTGLGQSLTIVTINQMVYEKLGSGGQALNNNKPWVALRAPTPTPQLQALQDSGPAGYLKVLANVDGKIYDGGRQTVHGVSTTKYSFRVDMFSILGSTFRQIAPNLTDAQIKQTGLDNLPMSVWLDDTGLTREMQMSFKYGPVSMHETMYLNPSQGIVHVTPPAPSETHVVHSLQELETILAGSTGAGSGL